MRPDILERYGDTELGRFVAHYEYISKVYTDVGRGRRVGREDLITAMALADFQLTNYYRRLLPVPPRVAVGRPALRLIVGGRKRS
jgi:hypothetical protein